MSGSMSEANLLLVGTAATYAIVMLSLVLLTGYGGHVSLAQFTFTGVGALAYAKLDEPNLYGLFLSALIAAGVGALVALPVLRLTGLYLALWRRWRSPRSWTSCCSRPSSRSASTARSRPSGSRSSAGRSARPAATSS